VAEGAVVMTQITTATMMMMIVMTMIVMIMMTMTMMMYNDDLIELPKG